jgi:hypothetical protein
MMHGPTSRTIACVALVWAVSSCERATPREDMIGDATMELAYRTAGTWRDRFDIRVVPGEMLVIQHAKCPKVPTAGRISYDPLGVCVIRIDEAQSKAFEAAMAPYKKYAIPLYSFSIENTAPSGPDGRACQGALDAPWYALEWTTTRGTEIAVFDAGCYEKSPSFYEALEKMPEKLPIPAELRDH